MKKIINSNWIPWNWDWSIFTGEPPREHIKPKRNTIKLIVNYSHRKAPLYSSLVNRACILDFDNAEQITNDSIREGISKYQRGYVNIERIDKIN